MLTSTKSAPSTPPAPWPDDDPNLVADDVVVSLDDDQSCAARGVVISALLGIPCWGLVGLVIWRALD